MRKVFVVFASKASDLVKKVNDAFEQADKQGNKIYNTQYVYADMDKYYCFIEYDNVVDKSK